MASAGDERAVSPRVSIHGVLVNVFGNGVFITGPSGIGKSACALELIDAGHQLVADDAIDIERTGNDLFGSAPPALQGLIEIRGLGICDIRHLVGGDRFLERQRIDLSIEFRDEMDNRERDRVGAKNVQVSLLGLNIPQVIFKVAAAQNLRLLVEIAVKHFALNDSAETDLMARHNKALQSSLAAAGGLPAQAET